jgi:hypothetical protein
MFLAFVTLRAGLAALLRAGFVFRAGFRDFGRAFAVAGRDFDFLRGAMIVCLPI